MIDSKAGASNRVPRALESHKPAVSENDRGLARLPVIEATAIAVNENSGALSRKVTRKKRMVSV